MEEMEDLQRRHDQALVKMSNAEQIFNIFWADQTRRRAREKLDFYFEGIEDYATKYGIFEKANARYRDERDLGIRPAKLAR